MGSYGTHQQLGYGQTASGSNLGNCIVNNQGNIPLIKTKLAIEPISVEEICRMNKEFLEPIINNSEFLYIL